MAKILTKNSVTTGSAPSGLSFGELAVNITDKKIFIGNAVQGVVTLHDQQNVVTSINGSTGSVSNIAVTNAAQTFSGLQTFSTGVSAATIYAATVGGDEGGQVDFGNPITNTTLSGGVAIDIYQNKMRFYEKGGSARGFFIDISAGGAGVGTELSGGAAVTSVSGSGNGILVSPTTGAVVVSNTGVHSINGSTGAITNVARINEGNTFSVVQVMNAGVTSANLYVSGGATFSTVYSSTTTNNVDILASTDGIGLRLAQNVGGGAAAVGGIRLGRSATTSLNYLLYAAAGTFYIINGTGGANPQLMTINSNDANFNVPIRGATFSSTDGRITVQKSSYVGSDSGTVRIVGADISNNPYNSDIRANASAAADTTHTLPATSGTLLNGSSTINATTSTVTTSNVNATRYLAFVGGTGNTGIFIDDVTTPLTYNPQGGNIGAKKVTLTTSANVLTLDSASPNVTLTDGANVAIFGLDSFAANYTSGRFTISNDGDGLDINALNGITLDPGSGIVEIASAVVSDGGYRITSNAINSQTDSYSLQESDNGKVITVNAGSVKTITVPTGLSVGFNCTVMRIGTGRVTFSASGTTINSVDGLLEIASQHGAASLLCYASNTFNLSGNLA